MGLDGSEDAAAATAAAAEPGDFFTVAWLEYQARLVGLLQDIKGLVKGYSSADFVLDKEIFIITKRQAYIHGFAAPLAHHLLFLAADTGRDCKMAFLS
jgi:hypothetical protein